MGQINRDEPIDYVMGFSDFLGCKIDLSYKPLIPRVETEFWLQHVITQINADYTRTNAEKDRREPLLAGKAGAASSPRKSAVRVPNLFRVGAFGLPNPPAGGGGARFTCPTYSDGRFRVAESASRRRRRAIRMLDLFAGSGCIGIAILKHVKNSVVHFGELNEKFLKQIRKNLKLNKISLKRAKLIKTDVFKNIRDRYDYIFANPPYVAKKKDVKIQPAVLKYEPKSAIFGGKDGLFYIRKLINKGKKYLKPGGRIYFEFSPEQRDKIERLLKQNNWHYQFFRDQYHRWRYLRIQNVNIKN